MQYILTFNYEISKNFNLNYMTEEQKQIKQLADQTSESLLLLGIKFNALKATLDDAQLNTYNNFILDFIKSNEVYLKQKLSPKRYEELVSHALR